MRVLVACEYSGIVRDAFLAKGHSAYSCDLEPTESRPERHYQADALEIAYGQEWDLMIAHPPCTYLANSGSLRLYENPDRWAKMVQGASFFKSLLNAPIYRICIENPILHKYAIQIIGRRQDQIVQPWMFGHGESKATCFWLRNLPPLEATEAGIGERQAIMEMSPSPTRGKERARTYPGIAKAMAEQWNF